MMKESNLYKVNVKLGTWIDVRMDREFYVAPDHDSESEAEVMARKIIEIEWGDEWQVIELKITDIMSKVYTEKGFSRSEDYFKSRAY